MICTKLSPWKLVSLVKMDTLSHYWLTKFIQEVAKPLKERYPDKTLHQIVCGKIRRFIEVEVFNPLDASDKSSVVLRDTCHYLF